MKPGKTLEQRVGPISKCWLLSPLATSTGVWSMVSSSSSKRPSLPPTDCRAQAECECFPEGGGPSASISGPTHTGAQAQSSNQYTQPIVALGSQPPATGAESWSDHRSSRGWESGGSQRGECVSWVPRGPRATAEGPVRVGLTVLTPAPTPGVRGRDEAGMGSGRARQAGGSPTTVPAAPKPCWAIFTRPPLSVSPFLL